MGCGKNETALEETKYIHSKDGSKKKRATQIQSFLHQNGDEKSKPRRNNILLCLSCS